MELLTELLALIAGWDENTTEEARAEALAAFFAERPDADLEGLEAAAEARTTELLEAEGGVTDEALAELDGIAVAVEAARERAQELTAAEQARTDRAQELADRIRGQVEGEGGEGEGGDGTTTEDDGADGEGEPAPAEVPAEVPDEADAPEAVAAAGARRAPAPRIGRVSARRPAGSPPVTPPRPATQLGRMPDSIEEWGLVASANAAAGNSGLTAGQPIRTRDQLAQAFLATIEATRGYRQGPRVKVPIFRAGNENAEALYGPDQFLGRDPIRNNQLIEARRAADAEALPAIVAAGGRCVPSPVRYDFPVIGDDARPVRDQMMTRFGADRGGVVTIPPPLLTDLDGAIGIWTEANDQTPADPTTKPCLTITCPEEDEGIVDAVTRCLQTGNFRARFFPEQVEAWMRLAGVAHARTAEVRLLTAIGDGSTDVGGLGQLLGATRDAVANLDLALAAFTSRHRAPGAMWRWGAPFWLYNMLRSDLAREMPGSTDERLAAADSQLDTIFRAHGVVPTLLLDGESGQMFGAQGDGQILGWPPDVVTYLYPEGSWLFLDGGSLDLGIVRDSTLNSTNDLQMFAETFEGSHFHGIESYRLTMPLCPTGMASGTVDVSCAEVGS